MSSALHGYIPIAGWQDRFVQHPARHPDVLTRAYGHGRPSCLRATAAYGPLTSAALVAAFGHSVLKRRNLLGASSRQWRPVTCAATDEKAASSSKQNEDKEKPSSSAKSVGELNEDDDELFANDGIEDAFDPRAQVGVTEPFGFFDPLGLSDTVDRDGWRYWRAAEIKHGRVAMMASIGLVVECYVRFPNFEGRDILLVIGKDLNVTPPFVLICILAIVELSIWVELEDRDPGDFGDPFGFNDYSEDMRNRELNNGRFAMFATTGILAAQWFTGKNAIEQLGL